MKDSGTTAPLTPSPFSPSPQKTRCKRRERGVFDCPPRLSCLGGIVVLLILLTACNANPTPTAESVLPSGGVVIDPARAVADATLTDQTGKPMHLNDLRGRVSLVFFGYTNCPDACPITVSDWTRVKKALGADADKTAFVFISVDPKRDTPEQLTKFMSAFDKSFIGLTADIPTVQKIANDVGAVFAEADDKGIIGHSSSAFLLDAELKARADYPVGTRPAAIAADIQAMLKNGGK